ncbi:MAG: metallophosphoesterase [Rhodothermales bacterium]
MPIARHPSDVKIGIAFLICLFFYTPAIGQSLPFYDGFDDGDFAGWSVHDDVEPQSGPSQWVVENGVLVQKSNIWSYAPVELETKYHLGTHVVAGDAAWADYSLNVIARSADNDGIGLIFRYQDARNYYRVLLMNDPAWSGRDINGVAVNTPIQRIEKYADGEPYILAENKVAQAYPSGFFSLTAEARGDTLTAYLNGDAILTIVDTSYTAGPVGLLSYANAGAYYDSVSVTAEPLVYDGAGSVATTYPVREFRAPYIQDPTQTSFSVAWRTLEAYAGEVRYDTEKDLLRFSAVEADATKKHFVRVDGLEPGQRYYYAVYDGDTEVQGEEKTRTARGPDETQFSFLVLGDSGVDTPSQWRVGAEMRESMDRQEIDFVVHVGDVHQGIGDYYDNIYFKPYREIIKNVNIFTSLGNHDVITDNGDVYIDDFYLPHNNPDSTERYYSFRWANAFFIALDTNGDYSPGSPQYQFLVEQLESKEREDALWTFIYAHHPPFSEYWVGYYGEAGVQNDLMPLYERYGVDMVMNGHTHSYERGEKEHVHYLISGGGGGALDDFFVDYEHISYSRKAHHFTRIDVVDDQLTVSATDEFGTPIDHFVIDKYTQVAREPGPLVPAGLELDQNFPNPVAGSTSIRYRVPEPGPVRLELFDLLGKHIATLVDRQHIPGSYLATYDTVRLAAGTYLLRLTSGETSVSRQMKVVD